MNNKTIAELAALLGLPYRINHIPPYQSPGVRAPNRPGRLRPGRVPLHDTVHDTANTHAGANAHMHEMYVRAPNWGGDEQTSYHHVVDDHEAIELLPWEEVAYHGGTPTSNTYWLGMELCVNSDGDWAKTFDNAAKLLACKAVKFGKPVGWIVQHWAAYGKDCPGKIRHKAGEWERLLALTSTYITKLEGLLMDEQTINGHKVSGKFLHEYLANGVEEIGLPISEVVNMTFPNLGAIPVQWFERTRLELQRDGTVTRGLVGAESYAAWQAGPH